MLQWLLAGELIHAGLHLHFHQHLHDQSWHLSGLSTGKSQGMQATNEQSRVCLDVPQVMLLGDAARSAAEHA